MWRSKNALRESRHLVCHSDVLSGLASGDSPIVARRTWGRTVSADASRSVTSPLVSTSASPVSPTVVDSRDNPPEDVARKARSRSVSARLSVASIRPVP